MLPEMFDGPYARTSVMWSGGVVTVLMWSCGDRLDVVRYGRDVAMLTDLVTPKPHTLYPKS